MEDSAEDVTYENKLQIEFVRRNGERHSCTCDEAGEINTVYLFGVFSDNL